MPARSKQQAKFFYAMENNPKEAAKRGISPEVAHEFTDGMTKKRFAKLKEKIGKK
jgi:hypothetical protein